MTHRVRLDSELVRRKLATSRSHARELIEQHNVTVAGAIATNPTRLVSPAEPIEVTAPPPRFVGRGGFKLLAALERFAVQVNGKHALDVGASTGGFTDCWLQLGATSVVALDVGHGQIHERLRNDERVTVLVRTNIRHTTPDNLAGAPFPLISVDISFISLTTIAPALMALAGNGSDLILLIKPQFEAGRQEVSRGQGVVRDESTWKTTILQVVDSTQALGAATMGVMKSPIVGAQGNIEFLAWLRAGVEPMSVDEIGSAVDLAIAEPTGAH
jgi:23S rRNA (cytidine1920-2'-O)/16S rRNA (cytidine1409-2'-O)-methyltransferase